MKNYNFPLNHIKAAPKRWGRSCTHTEYSLHQLSPYIGKLKSSIASDLITRYTDKGDLIADVFCGSGTIPLEAACHGRRIFSTDAGTYATVLTKGKLFAPNSITAAMDSLDKALNLAKSYRIDLRRVPRWVRDFYHPKTLKEMLQLFEALKQKSDYFLMSCLLGISHHQRPGFLSYPSSHLVPYLRSKKFPREIYPDLYEYRKVEPRIRAKIVRALKRPPSPIDPGLIVDVRRSRIRSLSIPKEIDCFITSPPYMNALDYSRDNRLRNWFLERRVNNKIDESLRGIRGFRDAMRSFARIIHYNLRPDGICIFIVGEHKKRNGYGSPSEVLSKIFSELCPSLKLLEVINDSIPDIRRSRRNQSGVKTEHIMIYQSI